MKWVAAVLMVVNVAIFLWSGEKQVGRHAVPAAAEPEVNREVMLLLYETGESSPAAGRPVVAGQDADATSGAAPEELASLSERGGACYRIGPFREADSWSQATLWMAEIGVEYRHVTSASRELKAIRVFLGPYAEPALAEPVLEKLRQTDFEHFVYQGGDGAARISLGYFTQEELARRFLEYLNSVGIEADSQPEYRTLGPFNWMEIPVEAIDEERLISRQWRENAVELSRTGC